MPGRPLASDFEFDVNDWYYFVTFKPRQKLILELRASKASYTDGNRVTWKNFLGQSGKVLLESRYLYEKTTGADGSPMTKQRVMPDWARPKNATRILELIDQCFCECGRDLGPLCTECMTDFHVEAAVSYAALEDLPTRKPRLH